MITTHSFSDDDDLPLTSLKGRVGIEATDDAVVPSASSVKPFSMYPSAFELDKSSVCCQFF